MKKFMYYALCGLVCSALLVSCDKEDDTATPKNATQLIIDSDMVESFDDGIAFMMLLGSENIDIKGLTTVTTNVWAQEGLAYGIRLGELCGGRNITYIAGSQFPLRKERLGNISKEVETNPGEDASWLGAISYPEVNDWKTFYIEKYGRQPSIQAKSIDASEYIAQEILSAPGKVTILAIGACTNIAKALTAHPEIAPKAKEIVYMGGAVYCQGNTTPYAEMNFLYDPEAAAICLRAPFPKQTIVSLDVCNTVKMNYEMFISFYNSFQTEEIKNMISSNYPFTEFQSDPSYTQYIWDLISAAIVIDPSIITEYKDVKIDIDDNPKSSMYGKSFETENTLRQTVRIPTKIDQERFWNILMSNISKF